MEWVRGERAEGSYIMTKWKRPDAQVCINFDLVPPNGREVPHRPADWGDGDYAGNSSDATKFGVVKKSSSPIQMVIASVLGRLNGRNGNTSEAGHFQTHPPVLALAQGRPAQGMMMQ